MNEEKTILILGSPRSGTSLTSGIINILGVDLGSHKKPDSQNPMGYFEDIEISKLCAKIYQSAKSDAHGFNLPSKEQIKTVGLKFNNEIEKVIKYKRKQSESLIWGWKVLATGLLFDLFYPYIKNPHLIVVLRNPLDIAKSISVYTQHKPMYTPLSIKESLKILFEYYTYVSNITLKYPEIPVLFISYEDILNEHQKIILNISTFLDIKINNKQLSEIKKLIKSRGKIRKVKKTQMLKETIVFNSKQLTKKIIKKILY